MTNFRRPDEPLYLFIFPLRGGHLNPLKTQWLRVLMFTLQLRLKIRLRVHMTDSSPVGGGGGGGGWMGAKNLSQLWLKIRLRVHMTDFSPVGELKFCCDNMTNLRHPDGPLFRHAAGILIH